MSAKNYNHKDIEAKWQERWEEEGIYNTPDQVEGKENYYILFEFPYPSGNLHIGHWYAFGPTDIIARYHRMSGKNVLLPVGFDSFGLPAENAAIKRGLDPREWTYSNIEHMTTQLKSMGMMVDWSREVKSSDPDFYKWTQYIFTKFFEAGLAYEDEVAVNYCPGCKTVLANEQVVTGKCERCGATIEKKLQKQWMLRVTDYAEKLLADLDELDWPEEIKAAQRAWIGKSEGARFKFEIKAEPKNYILLHGWEGSSDLNWFPWLKNELENRGNTVVVPDLPNSSNPDVSEQAKFVLDNYNFSSNSVIIAHSFGCPVALKIVNSLEHKIDSVYLVAPFIDCEFKEGKEPNFSANFNFEVDKKTLKNKADFHILQASEDNYITDKQITEIEKLLSVKRDVVDFEVEHAMGQREPKLLTKITNNVEVFTTRADTLFGVTYLVLAPEHPLLQNLAVGPLNNWEEVKSYIKEAQAKSEIERQENKDKTGVKLEGVIAIHPATGEELPIYVADYVLGSVGTGAVMAVPAHDERDFEFAQKFNLAIKQVISKIFWDERVDKNFDLTTAKKIVSSMGVIQRSDGKILLQKLNIGGNNIIRLPGGTNDEGETAHEALLREIEEETGYKFLNSKFESNECIKIHAQWKIEEDKSIHVRTKKAWKLVFEEGKLTNALQGDAYEEDATYDWYAVDEALEVMDSEIFSDEVWLVRQMFYPKSIEEKGIVVNSKKFNGLNSEVAGKKITEEFGEKATTYRLRDWSVGRQRYWGCPIPIVYDPKGTPHAIPQEHLPWILPDDVDHAPDGTAPLARSKKLRRRTSIIFGEGWTPAVDTFDTFVDSSWYYLRYLDPDNKFQITNPKLQKKWMPVDFYSGGAEHTTMHLLYARFFYKAMRDCGLLAENTGTEPFKVRLNRSLILGPDGAKMSKSKGNVIDPDEQLEYVGADTIRTYLAFLGPYNEVSTYPWDTGGIAGVRRFLERLSGALEFISDSSNHEVEVELNRAIKKVGDEIKSAKLNTAVSALMILINTIEKEGELAKDQYERLLLILAPFAPHLAEELWEQIGNNFSIHQEEWPKYDDKLLQDEKILLPVQINGKKRGEVEINRGATQEEVLSSAEQHDDISRWLDSVEIKKIIYVPNRILNLVIDKKN